MTPEENRERCKEYYQKHRNDILKTRKEDRNKNPEKYAKRWSKYRKNHQEQEIERSKEYRKSHPHKMKMLQKQWNEKNKEYARNLQKEWRQKHRNEVDKYKIRGNCATCGLICTEENKNIFSFHHNNPEEKTLSISYMSSHMMPMTKIITEIEKCSLICENCHRRIHCDRKTSPNVRIRKIKEWYYDFMVDKNCEICGESDTCCLDWHHTLPENKKYEVSYLLQHGSSVEKLTEEIEKCVCLCANCHRLRHLHL